MSGDFRQKQGRERSPSAGIMDSQSSKTIAISHQESGFDAGKLVKGRKRHLVVDVLGLVLAVFVHSANIQDRDGAKMLLQRLFDNRWDFPRLKVFFADGGVRRTFAELGGQNFQKIELGFEHSQTKRTPQIPSPAQTMSRRKNLRMADLVA